MLKCHSDEILGSETDSRKWAAVGYRTTFKQGAWSKGKRRHRGEGAMAGWKAASELTLNVLCRDS